MTPDDLVQFYPWIKPHFTEEEIILQGRFNQKKQFFVNENPCMISIIKIINSNKCSFKDIQIKALEEFSISLIDSKKIINTLFSNGFIIENQKH